MSNLLRLALVVETLIASPALGAEPIKPTLEINEFRVVIAFVSINELAILQDKFGSRIDMRDVRQSHRHGFTILRTNLESGERTCEIYLPAGKRPREVDDEATLSLGHELMHCMRGAYHRGS